MIAVESTPTFLKWLRQLRDERARGLINSRIARLGYGLLGDEHAIGHGVRELRIHYGPGYRLYYLPQGSKLIILLCGGDKSTQTADIANAIRIATKELEDD